MFILPRTSLNKFDQGQPAIVRVTMEISPMTEHLQPVRTVVNVIVCPLRENCSHHICANHGSPSFLLLSILRNDTFNKCLQRYKGRLPKRCSVIPIVFSLALRTSSATHYNWRRKITNHLLTIGRDIFQRSNSVNVVQEAANR